MSTVLLCVPMSMNRCYMPWWYGAVSNDDRMGLSGSWDWGGDDPKVEDAWLGEGWYCMYDII